MSKGFITQFLKILGLVTIGLGSLVFLYVKSADNKVYIGSGEITSSEYGIGFLDKNKNFFLLGYPANDIYYNGTEKGQLLTSVKKAEKGAFFSEIWLTFTDLISNRQHLNVEFKGERALTYEVLASHNRIEITRKIKLEKSFNAIGEVLQICSLCMIVDDGGRLYFNENFVNQDAVDFAKGHGLTAFFVGSDQFFPKKLRKITILDNKGIKRMTLLVFPYNQVFLRDKTHLEFKTYVKEEKSASLIQIIDL